MTEDYTNLISTVPEIGESNIRVIVYGDYGVGKTRLIGTFPNVLLLNYDKGEKTLAGKKVACINFDKYATDKDNNEISTKNYTRTIQILTDAINLTGPFAKGGVLEYIETIALDDLTTLSAFLLYDLKKFSKHKVKDPELDKAEYKHYDAVANQVIRIMELLKMATENFNVITTAGQKLDENEVTKKQTGFPNLVGKTRQRLGHYFDCIWHMEIEGVGQKRQYVLHLGPHTPFTGKTRGEGKQGGKIIDPNYAKIVNSLDENTK